MKVLILMSLFVMVSCSHMRWNRDSFFIGAADHGGSLASQQAAMASQAGFDAGNAAMDAGNAASMHMMHHTPGF